MDGETLMAAIGFMKAMPDNAAASAAEAKEYAESVTPATVAETKSYLGIS